MIKMLISTLPSRCRINGCISRAALSSPDFSRPGDRPPLRAAVQTAGQEDEGSSERSCRQSPGQRRNDGGLISRHHVVVLDSCVSCEPERTTHSRRQVCLATFALLVAAFVAFSATYSTAQSAWMADGWFSTPRTLPSQHAAHQVTRMKAGMGSDATRGCVWLTPACMLSGGQGT